MLHAAATETESLTVVSPSPRVNGVTALDQRSTLVLRVFAVTVARLSLVWPFLLMSRRKIEGVKVIETLR